MEDDSEDFVKENEHNNKQATNNSTCYVQSIIILQHGGRGLASLGTHIVQKRFSNLVQNIPTIYIKNVARVVLVFSPTASSVDTLVFAELDVKYPKQWRFLNLKMLCRYFGPVTNNSTCYHPMQFYVSNAKILLTVEAFSNISLEADHKRNFWQIRRVIEIHSNTLNEMFDVRKFINLLSKVNYKKIPKKVDEILLDGFRVFVDAVKHISQHRLIPLFKQLHKLDAKDSVVFHELENDLQIVWT
ncbi:hypothetical protein HELRODRAFT_178758 [Helobdella robusta]|uniref:Uncharacterized protein n=1 Tax=Helobdella robusta TaxID=6412 RepID=T1FDP2_HELRO|nr:hypothetical protein HELRODRAFT_178758 [Helobdella robusta]ESN96956.1 hypothetical protein HELRODRAFT_178758 [Helobdella robusta]